MCHLLFDQKKKAGHLKSQCLRHFSYLLIDNKYHFSDLPDPVCWCFVAVDHRCVSPLLCFLGAVVCFLSTLSIDHAR